MWPPALYAPRADAPIMPYFPAPKTRLCPFSAIFCRDARQIRDRFCQFAHLMSQKRIYSYLFILSHLRCIFSDFIQNNRRLSELSLKIATNCNLPQLDYTSQIHGGQAVRTTAMHNLHRIYFSKHTKHKNLY